MKVLICLRGLGSTGKTSSILRAYNLFESINKQIYAKSGTDICASVSVGGHLVGFASQGDPNSFQEEWIEYLIKMSCPVIVCASRTKGQTAEALNRIAGKYNYRVIYMSPFTSYSYHNTDLLNEVTARAINNLISNLLT